jgi:hypothetical protein
MSPWDEVSEHMQKASIFQFMKSIELPGRMIRAATRQIFAAFDSVSRIHGSKGRKNRSQRLRSRQSLSVFGASSEGLSMIRAFGIASAVMIALMAPLRPVAAVPSQSSAEPSADYVLGAGDRIRLSLYGDTTFSGEFAVADNGTVSLPLIGTQPAGGITVSAFRDAIEAKLADGYYRDPKLSAEVINFRPFYILGEVNKPGQYPYVTGMTLGQAVAIAEGYTYAARKGTIAIRRARTAEEVKVSANPAMPIGPGDTVRVLERIF